MDSDAKEKLGPTPPSGSACKRIGRQRRGRKPARETRAREIRARLTEWKQTPESLRSSLRALASEMGISHQLLGFYLHRLEEGQHEDNLPLQNFPEPFRRD